MGNDQMYSLGNTNSMSDTQIHGSGNEFLYSAPASSYSFTHPQQQHLQEHHYQQQLQPTNYHQQHYLRHLYNQNPLSDTYPYRTNYEFELQRQLNPPLHPPPPPCAEYTTPSVGPQHESLGGASTSAARESPILSATPTPPAPSGSNDPTTSAIDAINALSDLQNRWSVPVAGKRKDKETKNQKRKKRRKRGNKNVGSTSENPMVFRDEEEWIDGQHESCQKGYEPASGEREIDFPPLIKSDDDCSETVEMSTSELTTYVSVLREALDQEDGVIKAPKNQVIELLDDDDVKGEMEISDEDQDQGVQEKPGGQGKQAGTSGSKMRIEESPTSMVAAPSSNQEQDGSEKEKRALKLAELRAKAKLARTKLRSAERKKEQLSSTRNKIHASSPIPLPYTSSSPKKHPDITALRDVGSLVIKDVSRTGPTDEVRFVSSVYRLQECGKKDQGQDSTYVIAQPVTLTSEDKQKKSKSLVQQLQLARLQLEIKKKEIEKRELEKKIKSNSSMKCSAEQRVNETQSKEQNSEVGGKGVLIANQLKYETNGVDGWDDSKQNGSESSTLVGGAESCSKLEWLRRRQRELKRENEIANLRNVIKRQQGLIRQVGRDLTESSTHLQSITDEIKSKQELLEISEKKLIELNHRKRIIEGMVLRATEQLTAARKALSERRLLSLN